MHLYDMSKLLSENPEFDFSMADYDKFSCVAMQLDRIRRSGDVEIRPIANAILTDFRDFEKRLNLAIYNKVNAQNDTCVRIVQMMNMQASPESIKKAMEEFKTIQSDLEKATEQTKTAQEG